MKRRAMYSHETNGETSLSWKEQDGDGEGGRSIEKTWTRITTALILIYHRGGNGFACSPEWQVGELAGHQKWERSVDYLYFLLEVQVIYWSSHFWWPSILDDFVQFPKVGSVFFLQFFLHQSPTIIHTGICHPCNDDKNRPVLCLIYTYSKNKKNYIVFIYSGFNIQLACRADSLEQNNAKGAYLVILKTEQKDITPLRMSQILYD